MIEPSRVGVTSLDALLRTLDAETVLERLSTDDWPSADGAGATHAGVFFTSHVRPSFHGPSTSGGAAGAGERRGLRDGRGSYGGTAAVVLAAVLAASPGLIHGVAAGGGGGGGAVRGGVRMAI